MNMVRRSIEASDAIGQEQELERIRQVGRRYERRSVLMGATVVVAGWHSDVIASILAQTYHVLKIFVKIFILA